MPEIFCSTTLSFRGTLKDFKSSYKFFLKDIALPLGMIGRYPDIVTFLQSENKKAFEVLFASWCHWGMNLVGNQDII